MHVSLEIKLTIRHTQSCRLERRLCVVNSISNYTVLYLFIGQVFFSPRVRDSPFWGAAD